MRVYNIITDDDDLPKGVEFKILYPSFLERGGFMTITDKVKQKELNLPRWLDSTLIYLVDQQGTVWFKHPTQDYKFHVGFNSCKEFREAMIGEMDAYLSRNGYSLSDVKH